MSKWLATVTVVAAVGAWSPAAAGAADPITGQWAFSGGIVTVTASGIAFQGTVTKTTSFSAICPHLAGEIMWKSIVRQPDGQYRGRHQYEWWEGDQNGVKVCVAPRPNYFGNIALRITYDSSGRAKLKICFAPPEKPELQPSISEDGTVTNAPDGCVNSDPKGGVPPAPKFAEVFTMPSTRRCPLNSTGTFLIRVRDPIGDPLASITVQVGNKVVNTAQRNNGLMVAAISVGGIPRSATYRVTAGAKTLLGRTISGTVTYPKRSSFRRCG